MAVRSIATAVEPEAGVEGGRQGTPPGLRQSCWSCGQEQVDGAVGVAGVVS